MALTPLQREILNFYEGPPLRPHTSAELPQLRTFIWGLAILDLCLTAHLRPWPHMEGEPRPLIRGGDLLVDQLHIRLDVLEGGSTQQWGGKSLGDILRWTSTMRPPPREAQLYERALEIAMEVPGAERTILWLAAMLEWPTVAVYPTAHIQRMTGAIMRGRDELYWQDEWTGTSVATVRRHVRTLLRAGGRVS